MLRLANDTATIGAQIDTILPADNGPAHIVLAIPRAVPALGGRLAEGRIYGDPTAIVGVNDSGNPQKALDMRAHDHMVAALRARGCSRSCPKRPKRLSL